MPPSTPSTYDLDEYDESLTFWVRGLLVVIVLGLVLVFGIALWIQPYEPDGTPRLMATHLQMGLPPCTFALVTGVPCPACGMTTSFSLLARGDIVNSLRANWVGTLLASFCVLVIPWALCGILRGRLLFLGSLEKIALSVVILLMVLMMLRWGTIVMLAWLARGSW